MDKIIVEIIQNYELTKGEITEMKILVEAWRSLNYNDVQIKNELKNYSINL